MGRIQKEWVEKKSSKDKKIERKKREISLNPTTYSNREK